MQYLQNINQYKINDFYIHFFVLSSKCDVYFTPGVNFYLEAEILNLYLEFIKFTIEKVDSHIQVKFFSKILIFKCKF